MENTSSFGIHGSGNFLVGDSCWVRFLVCIPEKQAFWVTGLSKKFEIVHGMDYCSPCGSH
jgi:hypothetical protein